MVRAAIVGLLSAVVSLPAVAVQGELVIAREGSTEYHRPGCPVISDGKNVLAMERGQAEARRLKPHKDCDPSVVPPLPAGSPSAKSASKPIAVFIDESKFYHREKCDKLGKAPRRVSVDEAAKKRWPCPVCKPPIRPRPKSGSDQQHH